MNICHCSECNTPEDFDPDAMLIAKLKADNAELVGILNKLLENTKEADDRGDWDYEAGSIDPIIQMAKEYLAKHKACNCKHNEPKQGCDICE